VFSALFVFWTLCFGFSFVTIQFPREIKFAILQKEKGDLMKRIFFFILHTCLLVFATFLVSSFLEGGTHVYQFVRAEGSLPIVQEAITPKPSFAPFASLVRGTNVLLLGVAGVPYPAPFLTDTIMVGSFQGDPLQLTLTSLPRDLLVSIPGSARLVKINSLYELGKTFSPLEPDRFIREKVEAMTGLSIPYVAIIDVRGLEAIVDAAGGVDVNVEHDIADPFFPGPNYSYDPFYLSKGPHHLNGHDAVRFARSRHSPRGDFDRVRRQQQLLAAMRDRAGANKSLAASFVDLISQLNGHLITNVTLKDAPLFLGALLTPNLQIAHRIVENGPSGLLRQFKTQDGAYALSPNGGIDEYGEIQAFFGELH